MTHLSGQCLCGAVTFTFDGDITRTANCHCSDCRAATGAAYATLIFVPEDGVSITGTLHEYHHKADSGSDMTKLFCPTCGSQMFTRNSKRAGTLGIRAGVTNERDEVKPQANVYKSSAIPSTPLDPDLPAFDKMPG